MRAKLRHNSVLCLFLGAVLFVFWGCAGSKSSGGQASSSDSVQDVKMEDNSLEEAKQAAESAEWEAHRLREELNRKKNAK